MPKIHITKKYKRERKISPKQCSKKSFTIIKLGKKKKAVICCPKGKFKKGKCVVGTKIQSVLTPIGKK